MKIASAEVSLTSAHTFHQEQIREESLRMWVGDERPVFAGEEEPAVQVRISAAARQRHLAADAQAQVAQKTAEPNGAESAGEASGGGDARLNIIRFIIEALTGRKIKLADLRAVAEPPPQTIAGEEGVPAPEREGWGLEYDLHESLREEETLVFSATGQVLTADGRSIAFSLDLVMRREFAAGTDLQIRAGDGRRLVDPLVINFDGRGAELAGQSFAFDLDGDGESEQIASLTQGSGFLAFDRNGDGKINNGLELFGPATGHGFAELASLDSDGNGWLDESDPAYTQLKVWMRDAAGNESLSSLAERNIGAIMRTPVNTEFSLKNSENALLGRLRESSIFLKESGGTGVVQEIDLAV